jgi:hypothetical protein
MMPLVKEIFSLLRSTVLLVGGMIPLTLETMFVVEEKRSLIRELMSNVCLVLLWVLETLPFGPVALFLVV